MAARRFTLDFLRTEAAGGAMLALAALLGLVVANSPIAPLYGRALAAPQRLQVGGWSETLSGLDWARQGLMTVFFFVVGLEIKFEGVKGELSSPRRLALPVIAAAGGMVVPTLIYLGCNALLGGGAEAGWPIPVSTDVSLALAALAAGGRRLPPSLRTFLLALAVADDLGAVILIAVLFTHDVDGGALAVAAAALAAMAALSRWKRAPFLFWLTAAGVLWIYTLHSGVSPSVTGVAAAMTVPFAPRRAGERGVLERVSDAAHPYVAFLVLPLFAFCSAGVRIAALDLGDVLSAPTLGAFAGLAIGKPLGVFGAAALAIRFKLARKPAGVGWGELFAAALLCGAGFTMSLYIGALAFVDDPDFETQARVGILAASALSALAGGGLLMALQRPKS